MAALSLSIDAFRPLNRWDHDRIQPGNVGSVGDVNLQVRLKQSAPDMPMRFDQTWSHQNEVALGSNVRDGSRGGYMNSGLPAMVVDSNWVNRKFKTRHGWIYQDLRAPDTLHEPLLGSQPHHDWNNKVATAYEAFRTGNGFLPLPGAYALSPGEVPRGGSIPRIVGSEQREQGIDLTADNVFRNGGQDSDNSQGGWSGGRFK